MLEHGNFGLVSGRLSLDRHYPFPHYFQSSFFSFSDELIMKLPLSCGTLGRKASSGLVENRCGWGRFMMVLVTVDVQVRCARNDREARRLRPVARVLPVHRRTPHQTILLLLKINVPHWYLIRKKVLLINNNNNQW